MRIIIIGAGEVGYHVAKTLCRDNDVFIIEKNEDVCNRARQLDVQVLQGNGADVKMLRKANIDKAELVVAVTGVDEINLLCALLAKRLGAKKVIARADRPDYAELFEIVGVDVAISPIQATVNEVMKFTMGIGIDSLVTIEGEKGKILELTAKQGSKILNKKLKDVHFPRGAIVSAIVRDKEVIIPGGSHTILPEDKVVIFTLPSALPAVEELFG